MTYRDLVTLRKIRNEFAHAHEPVRFADTVIATLCAKLQMGKGRPSPRDQFTWAAASVVFRLEFYRRTARLPLAPSDGPPEELENA
jgi:hypothetical protein